MKSKSVKKKSVKKKELKSKKNKVAADGRKPGDRK